MKRFPSLRARLVLAAALVMLLAGAVTAASAAVPCNATVQGTPGTDKRYTDHLDKVFRVEITSSADCGLVYVDLVTTESLFNGEQITTTRRDWRKVSGSASTVYMFTFPMALDSNLVNWQFKVNRCVVCGTE